MKMFAIIRTGGKQYRVQKDDKLEVGKIDAQEGDTIDLDKVLFIGTEKESKVGSPLISGAKVVAEVLAQKRAPKIIVFKKKRRQNYRRKKGHRQHMTLLRIKEIKAA